MQLGGFGGVREFLGHEFAAFVQGLETVGRVVGERNMAFENRKGLDVVRQQTTAVAGGSSAGVIAEKVNPSRGKGIGNFTIAIRTALTSEPEPEAAEFQDKVFHGVLLLKRESIFY
jgi:hypothetical protein